MKIPFVNFIVHYLANNLVFLEIGAGSTIDKAIKEFSNNNRSILEGIRSVIVSVINSLNILLDFIPWYVTIIIVVLLGWKLSKKWYMGIVYGAMLLYISKAGLWHYMNRTISLVIMSVIVSVLLGFPTGILIALNKKVAKVIHPLLDLMQTMPTFVYLIPFVMLFQVGTTPALFATIIYAIVPMIRMTGHGIVYVDKEMIEASQAFGGTTFQTLIKVQIPQAIPTIMTGLNQTIMMAMSMVVTSSLIGAEGLGMEILLATNRLEMGKALINGTAVVFLAIILDRLTQNIVKKSEVPE